MLILRFTAVAAALMLPFTAWAQQPFAGEFLDAESGVMFRFAENTDGSLSGELVGASGTLPVTVESADGVLQAWFEVDGDYAALYGELLDQDTLSLWLYFMDETGQPLPGTEEQAVLVRQDPEPEGSATPSFAPPAMPGFAPAPGGALAETGADLTGVWAAELEVVPGTSLQLELTMNADGTYRHEISAAQGSESVAWEAGSYSTTDAGSLQLAPSQGSREMCFQGTCEPLELVVSTYRMEFLPGGELKLAEIGADGTPFAEVTYGQRTEATGSPAGETAPDVPAAPPAPAAPAPGQTLPPPPTF